MYNHKTGERSQHGEEEKRLKPVRNEQNRKDVMPVAHTEERRD